MQQKAEDFFDTVQAWTESLLTKRKRRVRIKKEKTRAKSAIRDWIESFIWAICAVLIINQYIFQAYVIPSGSMIDSLLINDRIIVNKLIFGPELLPGLAKLPSPFKPQRDDVIIFENPTYVSRGTAFDVAQRVIFYLTLSLVNIDTDASGETAVHFLIKRAAAVGGDTVKQERGNLLLKFAGEDRWVGETDYNKSIGLKHNISRLVKEAEYPVIEAYAKTNAYSELGLEVPADVQSLAAGINSMQAVDPLYYNEAWIKAMREARPESARFRTQFYRSNAGIYVPPGYVLPLGDNRDNSRDGRYFGAVRADKVLGKGAVIFWPIQRMGVIR
ncbi:MAG: signal peptidase I [Spirochaetaceae bacterium]|jgi:signal peptidase I|nr:signal peptidase I [Spirochaetaceae bacterium]